MIGVAARLKKNPKLPREVLYERARLKRLALRKEVIARYGGSCACCGEANLGFLTIDHMNGDGASHRRQINKAPLYRWLSVRGFPTGFQVLCFNCNCSKGIYGQCAHTIQRDADAADHVPIQV